ncbi:hypothetical protein H4582DRAFT_964232 [Lactarius indigo]|nr:hypothetical protein H4582DRAFT_964232 [Lactarius indigo]
MLLLSPWSTPALSRVLPPLHLLSCTSASIIRVRQAANPSESGERGWLHHLSLYCKIFIPHNHLMLYARLLVLYHCTPKLH